MTLIYNFDRYLDGEGVAKNDQQAVYWFTKAAEQGYQYAQNYLCAMYEDGRGVTQSDKQAAYWYTKALNRDTQSHNII
ncbi:tetratricopeptide repeat protein [Mannheimia sp. USDA-ARS-USMARC-1261]|uniref:tetratricopeptide repeat protein n=1 Tax=Mannheimia sp. USDA-ARS-USMARC-1261 TaxID=1432056 RepID=UPI000685F991|nr:SEL1-like repeat protein [Mannheimia sp. USDA-ARS-USMARC-1261]